MSAERYSKLQKWIIEQLYNITILRKYDDLAASNAIECKNYNPDKCSEGFCLSRDVYGTIISYKKCWNSLIDTCNCLSGNIDNCYILVAFYGFKTRHSKYFMGSETVVEGDSELSKARVSISRSIKSLVDKGIISVYGSKSCGYNYRLTDSGIRKAESLLSLEPCELPELNVNKSPNFAEDINI